jgi:hypothetical protein
MNSPINSTKRSQAMTTVIACQKDNQTTACFTCPHDKDRAGCILGRVEITSERAYKIIQFHRQFGMTTKDINELIDKVITGQEY